MNVTDIVQDGQSQVVRLPEEYCLKDDKVYIKKIGGAVVLIPYHAPWQSLFDSLDKFSVDFMERREQPPGQIRENPFK
ncbi:MAG: AbrB/MazE/SpoVT family DNA-binding domain-containing protein [Candidatus Aminicenantes bacterium]|nr:AbrB/MazE/SpoVT family DNA-binding domain-containing protein [Candidatus Aminicenantes bacterium]